MRRRSVYESREPIAARVRSPRCLVTGQRPSHQIKCGAGVGSNLAGMMNTRSRVTPWLALTLLSLSPELRADDTKPTDPGSSSSGVILSAGVGPANRGVVGMVSIQARQRSRLLGIRIASASPFELFGDSPSPSDTDYGVLYGRYAARRAGYTTVSAGLSVVSSLRRGRLLSTDCTLFFGCTGRFEKVVTHTVGIPFEARAVFSTRFAGLGIGVIGSLNSKGSFIGAGVTLEVGSLR